MNFKELLKKLDYKRIVYTVLFLGVAIYVLITFSNSKSKKQERNGGKIVLVKDERPKDRAFFSSYKEQEQASAYKSAATNNDYNYSNSTDDADINLLQELLRQQARDEENNINSENNKTIVVKTVQEQKQEQKQEQEVIIMKKDGTSDVISNEEVPVNETRFSKTAREVVNTNTVSVTTLREQTVTNGSTIKLVLNQKIKLHNGVTIPEKTIVTGVVGYSADRIDIYVADIVFNGNLMSINKHVYDMDGLRGIGTAVNLENLNNRSKAEQTAAMVPIVGATGVNVAASAVRTIFNSNSNSYEVTIRENYKLFLR